MITEPTTVLILHCDRDNEPLMDDDYGTPIHWEDRAQIAEAFKYGAYEGWIRLGRRFLCPNCWNDDEDNPVEFGPLSAIDEIRVVKERAAYAKAPV